MSNDEDMEAKALEVDSVSDAAAMMAGMQMAFIKRQFAETIGRIAQVVPALKTADSTCMFAAYCAGRMDMVQEMQRTLAVNEEAASLLVTRALLRVGEAAGQTPEDIKAGIDAAKAAQEAKENEHEPRH